MEEEKIGFEIDEILELKGLLFKVSLLDPTRRKMCLKQISKQEAKMLKELPSEQKAHNRYTPDSLPPSEEHRK